MVLRMFVDRETSQPEGLDSHHPNASEAKDLEVEIQAATSKLQKTTPETPGTTDVDVAVVVSQIASDLFLRGHRPATTRIMLQGILTELVSSLELLLGRLHGTFFLAHPEALGPTKEFSVADLKSLGGVDEAIESAIEGRVDEFLRLPFDDWDQWFKKYIKLNMSDFLIDKSSVMEIFARRNIVVHNDGVVSRQYRANVGSEAPKLGTRLIVDEQYVTTAIDQLLAFGATFAAAAWQKIAPEGAGAGESNRHLHELNLYLMLLDRWGAVSAIASIASAHVAADEADRMIYAINGMLATKRRGTSVSISAQAAALDVSASAPRFLVAKAALLDDFEQVAVSIPRAIAVLDMSLTDVHQWPLLDEFRGTPLYGELVDSLVLKPIRLKEPASRKDRGERPDATGESRQKSARPRPVARGIPAPVPKQKAPSAKIAKPRPTVH
jgi:hypothetical protein